MPDEPSTPSHAAATLEAGKAGGLVLVSTPIGNLGDITSRAIERLRTCDLILCEDTRTTARLLTHYDIATRTAPLHEHNEDSATPRILARLREGACIALVSDAGTPLVSDPGFRLVRAALAEGLDVQAVPGVSAVTMALTLSGLPPHPYLFLGFAPPRDAARRAAFTSLRAAERAGLNATLLWYEAPHRLADMLADLAQVFGPRPAAVARELTKKFEELRRAPLPDLAAHYAAHEARGEITVVVGPAPEETADAADLDALLTASLRTLSLREAAAAVAETTGLPRRMVYARALALKADS